MLVKTNAVLFHHSNQYTFVMFTFGDSVNDCGAVELYSIVIINVSDIMPT